MSVSTLCKRGLVMKFVAIWEGLWDAGLKSQARHSDPWDAILQGAGALAAATASAEQEFEERRKKVRDDRGQ